MNASSIVYSNRERLEGALPLNQSKSGVFGLIAHLQFSDAASIVFIPSALA